jgi:hypothetical protein
MHQIPEEIPKGVELPSHCRNNWERKEEGVQGMGDADTRSERISIIETNASQDGTANEKRVMAAMAFTASEIPRMKVYKNQEGQMKGNQHLRDALQETVQSIR